jgi:ABC-2 type transport system ATP-binding protein
VAKVLVTEPELLLLDEPATGLDPAARRDFRITLQTLRRERGVTVLLTTHFMEEAEACDRIALLDEGRIVALGRPAELVAEVGGEVVAVRVADPEEFARQAEERLGVSGSVVDGLVRFEQPDGHRLVTRLAETFPGALEEVRLTRPSLEDVFLRRTGHGFAEAVR